MQTSLVRQTLFFLCELKQHIRIVYRDLCCCHYAEIKYISKAKISGGFKNYFGFLELNKLEFIKEFSKDWIDTYEFNYNLGDRKTMHFNINAAGIGNKNRAKELVEAMKNFKK